MPEASDISGYILALQQALTDECIEYETSTCASWSKTTFPAIGRLSAIITPRDLQQLKSIISLAGQHQISIYPVSGGKNWGYGSRLPTSNTAVAVNLKALNNISDYHAEAGVITLEPGVTFQQVQTFLAQQDHGWALNGPGSSREASVIGNTAERGLNQGSQMERWRSITALEILLPDGSLLHTDAGATPSAFRGVPAGPDITGLFLQSNLGIITAMTLTLDRLPKNWRHLHMSWYDSERDLQKITSTLCHMRREGLLTASLAIHNAEKIFSLQQQYPFARTTGQTPLPIEIKQEWAMELGGDWFAETAIAAPTADALESIRQAITSNLAELPVELHWGESNANGAFYHRVTEPATEQVYWRKPGKSPQHLDPDRDACGVIWLVPVIPWQGEVLTEVVNCVTDITTHAGLEPLLSFQFPNHRYGYAVISLIYDRNLPEEEQRAMAAWQQLHDTMEQRGYHLYRHGLLEHAIQPDSVSSRERLLSKIKLLLDPAQIVAPGRYIPDKKD